MKKNAMRLNLQFYILATFIFLCFAKGISQPTWKYSGAPIGDTSTYKYSSVVGLLLTDSLILRHAAGQDSLRIVTPTGNPLAIHIYRVDQLPNVQCGLPGMLNNNRYFGVFVVVGSNNVFSWTAKYYYNGNPYVNSINEPFLKMYERYNNASTACSSWGNMNASLQNNGDTMTTGQRFINHKEMMMTFDDVVLPITLSDFSAEWETNEFKTEIKWKSEDVSDVSKFIVEKLNGSADWETVAEIFATTEQIKHDSGEYSVTDRKPNPVNYYRLKSISKTGEVSVSKIITLIKNSTEIEISSAYPNPTSSEVFVNVFSKEKMDYEYKLVSSTGNVLKTGRSTFEPGFSTVEVNMSDLATGIYCLQVSSPSNKTINLHKALIKN